MQCFMFVCEKLKTLFYLSNWIQQSIQKNASSRRKEELNFEYLSTRRLQSVIKVSSWRLYNVYNQQEEVFKPKIIVNNLVVDKA